MREERLRQYEKQARADPEWESEVLELVGEIRRLKEALDGTRPRSPGYAGAGQTAYLTPWASRHLFTLAPAKTPRVTPSTAATRSNLTLAKRRATKPGSTGPRGPGRPVR